MTRKLTYRVQHEGSSWSATCDEVPGYLLVAGDLTELRADIAFGLQEVLEIHDAEIVEVFEGVREDLVG